MVSELKLKLFSSFIIYISLILMIFFDFVLITWSVGITLLLSIWFYKGRRKVRREKGIIIIKDLIKKIKELAEIDRNLEILEEFHNLEKSIDLIMAERHNEYSLKKVEVDILILKDPNIIINNRNNFSQKLEEVYELINDILDYEEIKLNEFLELKSRLGYNIFIIGEISVFVITIILDIVAFAFFQMEYFLWFIFFLFIFRDIQYLTEKVFRRGYLRYKVVKKVLSKYQIQLKLVLKNTSNKYIYDFTKLKDSFLIIDERIDDYNDSIPPFYTYIRNIELIGIIGILITILIFFIQGYFYEFIELIRFDPINLLGSVLFFFTIIISPSLTKQREYKEKQLFKTIYSQIDDNLKEIRRIQFFFVVYYSKLFKKIDMS